MNSNKVFGFDGNFYTKTSKQIRRKIAGAASPNVTGILQYKIPAPGLKPTSLSSVSFHDQLQHCSSDRILISTASETGY